MGGRERMEREGKGEKRIEVIFIDHTIMYYVFLQ